MDHMYSVRVALTLTILHHTLISLYCDSIIQQITYYTIIVTYFDHCWEHKVLCNYEKQNGAEVENIDWLFEILKNLYMNC